jgi:N-methylhydantoinase B/oxoprolinase/acetone carboxylase alpha subunit
VANAPHLPVHLGSMQFAGTERRVDLVLVVIVVVAVVAVVVVVVVVVVIVVIVVVAVVAVVVVVVVVLLLSYQPVKYQINNALDWKKGEVILTNHPAAGGSHLPDFTVITPVRMRFY